MTSKSLKTAKKLKKRTFRLFCAVSANMCWSGTKWSESSIFVTHSAKKTKRKLFQLFCRFQAFLTSFNNFSSKTWESDPEQYNTFIHFCCLSNCPFKIWFFIIKFFIWIWIYYYEKSYFKWTYIVRWLCKLLVCTMTSPVTKTAKTSKWLRI